MKKIIEKRLNRLRNDWEIENLFYKNTDKSRTVKLLNHFELLKKSKKAKGSIIECGVFKGNSLIRICIFRDYLNQKNKKIYGFDAFGSFPKTYLNVENSIVKKERDFASIHDTNSGKGLSVNSVRKILNKKKIKNYSLIKGDVLKTVNKFIKYKKDLKISFLHLDMDVYLPTIYVLDKFYKFISKGGIVVIDDFNTHPGATKATMEFLNKKRKKISVIKNSRPTYYFVK